MKLFPHIKKNLISFLRNGKVVIITFIIFPMLMAYIYGTMQEGNFSGKSGFTPITVEFKYNKTSKTGEILTSILKDKNVENFISTDFKDEPKCRVTVSDDFKNIEIQKLKGTDAEIEIINSFMKNFSESINEYKVIVDNVEKLNMTPAEKGKLIGSLVMKMQENSQLDTIEKRTVPGYRSLGAIEYFTISMFSYTSMMLIMILAKGFYKERKSGVVRRSFSTPNTKISYFTGYLISSFILSFSINIIYVVINRIIGTAFMQNFFFELIIVIMQSLLQAAVVGTIISFVDSEQVANAIMTILVIIPAIIGGVFFNADIIGVKLLKVLSNFSPNTLILNAFKNLSITQGIKGAASPMLIIAVLSAGLIIISMAKVKAGWEE
jgi:ABC-2 type transport system permease protein